MQTPTKTQIEVCGKNYLYYAKEFIKIMDDPAVSIQEKEAKLDVQQREWDSLRIMWVTLSLAIRRALGKDEEVMRLDFLQTMVQAYMEGRDPTPPKDGEKYIAVARTAAGWTCRVRMGDLNGVPTLHDPSCGELFAVRPVSPRGLTKVLHSEHHLIYPIWQYMADGKWLKL